MPHRHSNGVPPHVLLPAARGAGADLRRWLALSATCLAVIVIVMDGSIVNIALPTLARALPDASISRLQWVVDAYILAFAALLLTAGSAADRFGRRRLLLIGLASFALVSVGAAFAQTSGQLVFWRVLMGIAAAFIFPSTLAIITEDFEEPRLRRLAIAIWAGASGLGVAIGPVAGGWLLEHADWGSIFLVNLPLVAVAALGVGLFVHESKDDASPRLDPVGSVLAIAAILSLVWGLIEGPERGWLSASCAGALMASVALLGAFVWWELRVASPMLDLRFFGNPRFSGGCVAIAAAFFGLFGFVFMVTQYFQFLHGYDALSAGIRTTPFAGFILLGAILAARSERRLGSRGVVAGGLLLMAAGFLWAARDTLATAYLTMVWQMGVLGVGLGAVNAAATATIMGALPVSRAGTGSSVNDTLREVGGTLGVAGMGSAFNALYRSGITASLADAPLPPEARTLIRSSLGGAMSVIERVQSIAGPDAANRLRVPIRDAFLSGFESSCWIAAAAASLGAIAVFLLMRPQPAKSSAGALAQA